MKLYIAEITRFSGETRPYAVFIDENDSNNWLNEHTAYYDDYDYSVDDDDIILCEDRFTIHYDVDGIVSVGNIVYVHCSNGIDSADIHGVYLHEDVLAYGYYKQFIIK